MEIIQAVPGRENIAVISSPIELQGGVDAVLEYWTTERMKHAKPIKAFMETDEIPGTGGEMVLMEETARESAYQEKIIEPQPADAGSSVNNGGVERNQNYPDQDGAIANGNFKTVKVARHDVLPYSAVGKLFMLFDGDDYEGTGWVGAEKAVFSAGHCLFDDQKGVRAEKLLFVPQFNGPHGPVEQWVGIEMYYLDAWEQERDYRFDMGVFVVDRPIRPKTGSLGVITNSHPNQGAYKSIGYPAEPSQGYGFDGLCMWECIGDYIDGANPIQMHNNMAGGSSGGPWVILRNGKAYVNGLNSFQCTNEPLTVYSPYFGREFIQLYDTVKNER